MFARLTRGTYDVAHESEIQRLTEQGLIPSMKKLPGFHSYRGGLDRGSGRLFALSIWDTAEQSRAVDALRIPFGTLIQLEPAEVYEITAQTVEHA